MTPLDLMALQAVTLFLHDSAGHLIAVNEPPYRRAAEAGTETADPFRGRGYGSLVTSRWASMVWDSGLIPLYSTSDDNTASQHLARSIGLVQYGVDLHFS